MVGVLIAALLVVGVGAAVMMGKKDTGYSDAMTEATTETQGEMDTAQPRSLKDLLALGISQKCTTDSGTVYFEGGKMRGDFETEVEGEVVMSHVIADSTDMYLWMDGEAKGFKSSIYSTTQAQESGKSTVDPDKKLDYKCESGISAETDFNLPEDVEFTDLAAMMVMPTGSTMMMDDATKCAACDALTGPSMTQCLTALGCN